LSASELKVVESSKALLTNLRLHKPEAVLCHETGYYVIFPDSGEGERQCRKCHEYWTEHEFKFLKQVAQLEIIRDEDGKKELFER
jgi:hypothetical protein